MAKQPATPKGKSPQTWSDITYIRCELDNQLKKDLQEWLKTKHDWFGYVEQAVGAGLRFQVLEDKFHNCYEARLTLLAQSTGVNTLVLQGRSATMLQAVQSLFFKHLVVLEGSWEDLERDEQRKYEDWG